nr:vegetative cell wall protein gp1-like [Aegilops tauschii subsp. strangulata]
MASTPFSVSLAHPAATVPAPRSPLLDPARAPRSSLRPSHVCAPYTPVPLKPSSASPHSPVPAAPDPPVHRSAVPATTVAAAASPPRSCTPPRPPLRVLPPAASHHGAPAPPLVARAWSLSLAADILPRHCLAPLRFWPARCHALACCCFVSRSSLASLADARAACCSRRASSYPPLPGRFGSSRPRPPRASSLTASPVPRSPPRVPPRPPQLLAGRRSGLLAGAVVAGGLATPVAGAPPCLSIWALAQSGAHARAR